MRKTDLIRLLCTGAILIYLTGCGALRTEFYRAEVTHLYKSAKTAYQARDTDEARDLLTRIVALDPAFAPAHVGLGHLCLADGEAAAACGHYQTALALDPDLRNMVEPYWVTAHHGRQLTPLVQSGVRLANIAELIAADRIPDARALITESVPVHLLARDVTALSLDRLQALTTAIEAQARTAQSPPRWQLFLTFYLANTRVHDHQALDTLNNLLPHLDETDRAAAYRLQGDLCRRLGNPNQAAQAYLKAVHHGAPVAAVAPFLAQLYKAPMEEITRGLSQSNLNFPIDR